VERTIPKNAGHLHLASALRCLSYDVLGAAAFSQDFGVSSAFTVLLARDLTFLSFAAFRLTCFASEKDKEWQRPYHCKKLNKQL